MKYSKSFDEKLKKHFNKESEFINADENMFFKIKNEINKKEKGEIFMKNNMSKNFKRFAGAVLVCFAAISCIAVAAPKISSWSSSTDLKSDSFESFPSEKEVKDSVGYLPKYVKSLPGGFEYESADVTNSQANDSEGNAVVKLKEFGIFYKRANEKEGAFLSFNASDMSQEIFNDEITSDSKLQKEQYNGIDLYYGEMPYLFLPPDYEVSEEDKAKQERGELEISYGSSEVERSFMQSLSWYEGDIKYLLLGMDINVSKEEMVEMAKEIIDK